MSILESRRSTLQLVATTIALCVLAGATATAQIYPDPPPDFATDNPPLRTYLTPTGGTTDRPMLVLFATYTDVATPAGVNETSIAARIFGPALSVADFVKTNSLSGDLDLTPAPEGSGTPNNGVVALNVGLSAPFRGGDIQNEVGNVMAALDAVIDFSVFDTNPPDDRLSPLELVVISISTSIPPGPGSADNCAGARHPAFAATPVTHVDGKEIDFLVGLHRTATNNMTIAHEVAHVFGGLMRLRSTNAISGEIPRTVGGQSPIMGYM